MTRRIVKVETKPPYFILQEKKWYGWKTYGESMLDDIGIYTCDMRFRSVKEVEKFIETHLTEPKRTIVKEW